MIEHCRGCETALTPENDSEAHVIPNALGGRLAHKGIICRACNTLLDRVADNALVEAFGDWPTLLDIPRNRGRNPPKVIETQGGHRVRMNADGSSTRIDVQYDVSDLEEGHLLEIGAGSLKTFRQLLNRAVQDFPSLDVKAAEAHAQRVGVLEDDPLRMRCNFSAPAVFGGIVAAVWLYLIITTGRAFMDRERLLSCIEGVQENGGTWRYFVEGLPGLTGPEIDLGHKLVVRTVPRTGDLIAYAEILSVLKVGGVFARSPNPGYVLEHIYTYDIVSRKDRSNQYSIDGDTFNRQDWSSVGLGPADTGALRSHFEEVLKRFVAQYERRFATGKA